MSKKVIGNQYQFNGPGYLDSKIQPVEHVEDLNKILLRQRFLGLTVTVIHPDGDDSSPADYWLVQNPDEEDGVLMWVKKSSDVEAEIDEIEERVDKISQWKIKKLSEDSGYTQYALIDDSGNPIGDTIDIVDEQYLESVEYIPSATEDDKAIDQAVVVGDPYLKFIWKYDIVTYVAIKDWVNDYFAGNGISISAGHEISVKLVERDENNQNFLSVDENGLKMNMFIEIDD